jgi:IS5 family transposase
MVGRKDRSRQSLFTFVPGDLTDFIPQDHLLRRVNRALKLSWVADEVRDAYCPDNGAPSVDPEVVIRLLIVGFLFNIIHIRELLREVQVNIAMRWFVGYGLDQDLPDHSSLSKIADRWGEERFKRIYQRVVKACVDAGLVDGSKVHIDATLIRANVSWESLKAVPTEGANPVAGKPASEGDDDRPAGQRKSGRPRKPPKVKKQSTTDPEATLATSSHNRRLEPCYKQHTAVDDKHGVITDVAVTTGEANEGEQLLAQLDRVAANTGVKVERVTADAGYAHSVNYQQLEQRGVDAIIPPQSENRHPGNLPIRRFKYDGRHQYVRCPRGRRLHFSHETVKGRIYSSRVRDCRNCQLRQHCLPARSTKRIILISHGYEALLRARRRKARGWDAETREMYNRHRWRAEGKHGEAKERHGLRRAVRRGRAKVAIQVYLTAIVMNLKLLAGLLAALWNWITERTLYREEASVSGRFGQNCALMPETRLAAA